MWLFGLVVCARGFSRSSSWHQILWSARGDASGNRVLVVALPNFIRPAPPELIPSPLRPTTFLADLGQTCRLELPKRLQVFVRPVPGAFI